MAQAKHSIDATPWKDRTALNRTRVMAQEAGFVLISAEQFYRLGQVNMGLQIQAIGCSVTPEFTTYPVETALNEDDAAQTMIWDPHPAIVGPKMTTFLAAATAIKLTFSGPGEAIIVSY